MRLPIPRPPARRWGAQEARSKRGAAAGGRGSRVSRHSIRRQSARRRSTRRFVDGCVVFMEAATPDPGPRLACEGEDHLERRTAALEEIAVLRAASHQVLDVRLVQLPSAEHDKCRRVVVQLPTGEIGEAPGCARFPHVDSPVCPGCAASAPRVASELEMAKSGASVATRQLVALGLVRGTGQRGRRRLLLRGHVRQRPSSPPATRTRGTSWSRSAAARRWRRPGRRSASSWSCRTCTPGCPTWCGGSSSAGAAEAAQTTSPGRPRETRPA